MKPQDGALTEHRALFATTIFLGAVLLFLVQPMFARLVLPTLGGAPAVWNTALVFYQAALLGGYAYAHFIARRLRPKAQVIVHVLLLLLGLACLPIRMPMGWTPPVNANPAFWLLELMCVTVGLPFLVVSATSPLLQTWFARTQSAGADDPYFLYGASNLGSLLALVAYPALVEPCLRLSAQGRLWTAAYVALGVAITFCGLRVRRAGAAPVGIAPAAVGIAVAKPAVVSSRWVPPPPGWRSRGRWMLLAFVPSSLMQGVTTYLSADVVSMPLLWVIPLAIYLLTFTLVFARRPLLPETLMWRALPIVGVSLTVALAMRMTEPLWLLLAVHWVFLFVAAMVCHGELSRGRPASQYLTEFYLWLSVGGVLGGIFNALVAPLIFTSPAEYPLVATLACALAPAAGMFGRRRRDHVLDFALPLVIGAATAALVLIMQERRLLIRTDVLGLVFGVPALLCFLLSGRPLRFGLSIGAVLLAAQLHHAGQGTLLRAERSFYGIHRVTLDSTGRFHQLFHGNTLHGRQSIEPGREREPLTYYFRDGPIGDLFATFEEPVRRSVAVVGLGSGSLACYAQAGETWTFYELDPVVKRLAEDSRYFTLLRDSTARTDVVLGDARLSLARAAAGQYGLIVLDAYSSDSIPVHLLTREALQLYLNKLAPHGCLVFHISNRHLDLQPVVANLARDAGLLCLVRDEDGISTADEWAGKTPSIWVVMTHAPADAARLAADFKWKSDPGQPRRPVWTDDYSSLLSVVVWR